MNDSLREHWETVYATRSEDQTSWYRPHLDESLRLIDGLDLDRVTPAIDIGGGRATLVDDLLARGFTDLAVLDMSQAALDGAAHRLGETAASIQWQCGDITLVDMPPSRYGLWHDRAVFHFLTSASDRARYVATAMRAIRPGGHVIIATFAGDGPERCSGLHVRRYEAEALAGEFAPAFERVGESREIHPTPFGTEQPFTYVVLRRRHDVGKP